MTMQEKVKQIDALCREARILPVITIGSMAEVLPMADALAAGGLKTLEVTLRSEFGLDAIRLLVRERPQLCIGAGTVLNAAMARDCVDAGARFLVSPGITPELLQAGVEAPVPLLPGIGSASELMQAYALGYRRFKLFPAEVCGGVAAIKALSGPFPDVCFCPTGGVTPANAAQYMALDNVMCVGGSWMLDKRNLEAGNWAAIEQASRDALAAL